MLYEKLPATLQKSYYGKAKTCTIDGKTILRSYNTNVCYYENGEFHRLWNGYSRTTMNHINDFRKLFGDSPLNKKQWESIPCDGCPADSTRYQVMRYSVMGLEPRKTGPIFDDYSDALSYAESMRINRFWYTDIEYV